MQMQLTMCANLIAGRICMCINSENTLRQERGCNFYIDNGQDKIIICTNVTIISNNCEIFKFFFPPPPPLITRYQILAKREISRLIPFRQNFRVVTNLLLFFPLTQGTWLTSFRDRAPISEKSKLESYRVKNSRYLGGEEEGTNHRQKERISSMIRVRSVREKIKK